jgi:hypothetical protein
VKSIQYIDLGFKQQIIRLELEPQKQRYWCWAACFQSILKLNGYCNIKQEDIVAQRFKISELQRDLDLIAFSKQYNQPLEATDFNQAFSNWGHIERHAHLDWETLKSELDNQRPVIVESDNGVPVSYHVCIVLGYAILFHKRFAILYNPKKTTISVHYFDENNFSLPFEAGYLVRVSPLQKLSSAVRTNEKRTSLPKNTEKHKPINGTTHTGKIVSDMTTIVNSLNSNLPLRILSAAVPDVLKTHVNEITLKTHQLNFKK